MMIISKTYMKNKKSHLKWWDFLMVEPRGFEPLTSTMRTLRATNCAKAPYFAAKRLFSLTPDHYNTAEQETQWGKSEKLLRN